MREFEYYSPNNLDEALSFLGDKSEGVYLIAGGTDIMLELHNKFIQPEVIVNLKRLNELNYITEDDEYVRIGANTTFSTIEKNDIILRNARALAQASSKVGSTQIRNLGTIGGNIVTGSACGDSVSALVAMDAVLVIKSAVGKREVSLEAFYKPNPEPRYDGCYINLAGIARDEILCEIYFKRAAPKEYSAFRKLGKRKALAKSIITVGIRMAFDDDNRVSNCRIALGAVGRHPYSVTSAEQIVEGKKMTDDVIEACVNEVSDVVYNNIRDRASCPFKKESVKELTREVINSILGYKSYKEVE